MSSGFVNCFDLFGIAGHGMSFIPDPFLHGSSSCECDRGSCIHEPRIFIGMSSSLWCTTTEPMFIDDEYTAPTIEATTITGCIMDNNVSQLKSIWTKSPGLINCYLVGHLRETPMHTAAIFGRTDVIKLLMEIGCRTIDSKDINGDTPMHAAVKRGYFKVVELLSKYGSKAHEIHNDQGHVPFHYSRCGKISEFLARLATGTSSEGAWENPLRIQIPGEPSGTESGDPDNLEGVE